MFLNSAEVAVYRVGGMHENSGLSRAHKRGYNLLCNVATFPDAGYNEPTLRTQNDANHFFKASVDRFRKLQQRVTFQLKRAFGGRKNR